MDAVSSRRFTHHVGAIAQLDAAIASAHAEIAEHLLGKGPFANRQALASLGLLRHRTPHSPQISFPSPKTKPNVDICLQYRSFRL
jgi:hypothetical protein